MINSEVLADCGLFFIAALGFAIITGVAGLALSIGEEDSYSTCRLVGWMSNVRYNCSTYVAGIN